MESTKIQETQVSTKEFLKSVFNFFQHLAKNWQILLIALLIGTAFDLVKNVIFKKDPVFTGETTFHLELEGGGGQNQLGGLASTFGLGGAGPGIKTGELLGATNFKSIVLSVNVFQNAFMREVNVGNKKELFINYYIDSSDIKKNEWAGNLFQDPSPYSNYRFTKKGINEFTPNENLIIGDVYNKIAMDTHVSPVENASLIDITAETTNELLTKVWIENLMATTEEFYKNMKTKKTRQLLEIQERRLDSLAYLVKTTDRKMARVTFDNPNVVDPSGIMKQQQINRDNTYITNQYFTQLVNVENLNRLIFEQTPIFTVLEPVRLPLGILEKTGISTRLGGIICLFASIFIVSLTKTFKEIMSETN